MQHKIVVRYLDGRVLKGYAVDFMPAKEVFHLVPMDAPPGSQNQKISIRECKALFFVKDFTGNPAYRDKQEFEVATTAGGRRIRVVFTDNEVMLGTTQGYQPGRPGFFIYPADPQSNIERCFVISAATKDVSFI
jgi:Family of unknown function (DUF6982)